jgi:hypothetical protein
MVHSVSAPACSLQIAFRIRTTFRTHPTVFGEIATLLSKPAVVKDLDENEVSDPTTMERGVAVGPHQRP